MKCQKVQPSYMEFLGFHDSFHRMNREYQIFNVVVTALLSLQKNFANSLFGKHETNSTELEVSNPRLISNKSNWSFVLKCPINNVKELFPLETLRQNLVFLSREKTALP